MKKIVGILVAIVLLAVIVFFGIQLVHKCDSCASWFVGTGYEPNVISEFVNAEEQTICKDCARTQHLLETTFGKSLDDFKKGLFD